MSDAKFETQPAEVNFHCEWGVWTVGGDSSFCYCTSEARGEFMAAALQHFYDSGEMTKWLNERESKQIGPATPSR